jgi:G3E family GTPase
MRLRAALHQMRGGVVRSRGRIWMANRPDYVVWFGSAGGNVLMTLADRWMATMDPAECARVELHQQLSAAALWDEDHGDRRTAITVLVVGVSAAAVTGLLDAALLDDVEFAAPRTWGHYADPFEASIRPQHRA